MLKIRRTFHVTLAAKVKRNATRGPKRRDELKELRNRIEQICKSYTVVRTKALVFSMTQLSIEVSCPNENVLRTIIADFEALVDHYDQLVVDDPELEDDD